MNNDSMTRPARIAIVEDDIDLLQSTEEYLRASGYEVWGVGSAEAFYKRFTVEPAEVVVLDIGLPGEDGLSVARHLQDLPKVAIIILSARDSSDDRLAGLRAGADRYLVKPVSLPELAANIEAIVRRSADAIEVTTPPAAATGAWQLSQQRWMLVSPAGAKLTLTAREYALLELLLQGAGQAVNKREIADRLFGPRVPTGAERVNVLLARLRKKAEAALQQDLPIKTVHQVGYAFTAPFRFES